MKFKIGSLSDKGWVSEPQAILSYLMACYIQSDIAQTLFFHGNITSLPNTYRQFINDPEKMATAMQSDINNLLSRYFSQVQVQTQAKQTSGSHYAVILYASVLTEDNERVELGRVVEMDTSELRRIIEVNNYGDAKNAFNQL